MVGIWMLEHTFDPPLQAQSGAGDGGLRRPSSLGLKLRDDPDDEQPLLGQRSFRFVCFKPAPAPARKNPGRPNPPAFDARTGRTRSGAA